MDVSINQYIKDLPPYCKKLDNINMEYNLDLKENRSIEEYAEEIYKSIKSRVKENNQYLEDNDLHEVDIGDSRKGLSLEEYCLKLKQKL